MQPQDRLTRLGPLSGVLFVALQLVGVAVSAAGGRSMASLGDATAKIVGDYGSAVDGAFWAGAYLELASAAAFCVFAAWLYRSDDGPLVVAGRIAAALYAALTVVALVVGDVLGYRAGHGIAAQEILALFDLQSGLFFATWGASALFLALAPVAGRLRQAALVIAALQLVALAYPTGGPSQFPNLLFLIWCVVAGIALARRPERAPAAAVTAATGGA